MTRTPRPPLPPREPQTYIDKKGVERWIDGDEKVSLDNAFRSPPVVNYGNMLQAANRSMRASGAVDASRRKGVEMGSIGGISNKADKALQDSPKPQHWAAR